MQRTIAALLAGGVLLLAGGCGSSGGSAPSASTPPASTSAPAAATGSVHSGTVQVAYRNVAIDPETIRVKVGTTIRWTNYDTVEHNVTSESGPQHFASTDFGQGGTFQIVARKPGVIRYLCTIHPSSMKGEIEVVG